jgi:hypothetical protein
MQLLRIYLQDHFATCTGMLELAKRTYGANRGTVFEQPLAELRDEIEADRAVLLDVMHRLGFGRDRLKDTATWGAEKAGRLKLNGRVRGYSPLSRVVEAEGLAMLLHGKRRMWEALGLLADDPRLAGVDPARMAARAEDQIRRVVELHARATALAFPLAPGASA